MSLHYLGKHESWKFFFSDSGKLSICQHHPHCRIEILHGADGGSSLRFEFHLNQTNGFGAVGVEIYPFSLAYTKS